MATRAGWTGALLLVASLTAHAEAPATCDMQGDFKSPQWRLACDAAIENEHNVRQRALLLQHRAYVAVEEYRYDDAIVDLDRAEGKFRKGLRLARVPGKGARVALGTYLDPKATQFDPAWEEVVS